MWGPLEGLAVLELPKNFDEVGHTRAKPRRTNRPARIAGLLARLIAVIRPD